MEGLPLNTRYPQLGARSMREHRFPNHLNLSSLGTWVAKERNLAGCGKTPVQSGFGKGTTSVVPLSRLDPLAL
jgi:hypothetical protein